MIFPLFTYFYFTHNHLVLLVPKFYFHSRSWLSFQCFPQILESKQWDISRCPDSKMHTPQLFCVCFFLIMQAAMLGSGCWLNEHSAVATTGKNFTSNSVEMIDASVGISLQGLVMN